MQGSRDLHLQGRLRVSVWAPEGELERPFALACSRPGKALATRKASSRGDKGDSGLGIWGLVLPSSQDWGIALLAWLSGR